MNASLVLRLLPGFGFGAALACAYVGLLRWNIGLYLGSRRPGAALLVHVVRWLLVVGGLFACARHGRAALSAALLGFAPLQVLLSALWRDVRPAASDPVP